jgi:hypothetical protein
MIATGSVVNTPDEANPKDLLKVHWYHPTLSEIWSYPLEELG